jgi:hypothetical protein
MNAQEIFTKSVQGVIAQGGPSRKNPGLCAYRGTNNRACAVGQVLTDDEYDPSMDVATNLGGTGVDSLVKRSLLPDHLKPHVPLLYRLQSLHDDMFDDNDLPQFISQAKKLAEEEGLTW